MTTALPFKKILIANRGEIAARIARTCKRMGIQAVAVYASEDIDAYHVREADEAYDLGLGDLTQTYLNIEKIIIAAKATGADAIHPGYGFLSENPDFAERVREADLVFIGPDARVIAMMGDKVAAKRAATTAGIPVVPGTLEPINELEEARGIAEIVGFPLMLKPAGGGGGKGMRRIESMAELEEGFIGAQREASRSFGDGRMFLERLIVNPRHIEVQVIADQYGHVVTLAERECSLQRRHQKVIEEAPCAFIDEALRQKLYSWARQLCIHVNYNSVGTVEFLVDAEGAAFFIEMNTRIQVEHPVTEAILNIDLVEHMIRIAAGERLQLASQEVQGHAIEARLLAEDPCRGFLPSGGRLAWFESDLAQEIVRFDTGHEKGDIVRLSYDPLVAKLIAHGATRQQALTQLCEALDSLYIKGIASNKSFLAMLLRHPAMVKGEIHTQFLEQNMDLSCDLYPSLTSVNGKLAAAAVVAWSLRDTARPPATIACMGDRDIANNTVLMKIERSSNESLILSTDAWSVTVSHCERLAPYAYRVRMNEESYVFTMAHEQGAWQITFQGQTFKMRLVAPHVAEMAARARFHAPQLGRKTIATSMPGKLIEVRVKVGDRIRQGQPLAIVEAMKMENILRSEHEAEVISILAEPGALLLHEQPLFEIDLNPKAPVT